MNLARFSRTFPSHAFGILFFGSVFAVFSAALLGLSRTVGNAVVLGAALFLLIPYLFELFRGIQRRAAIAAMAVAGWVVCVYLVYGEQSVSGTIRLGILLFYLVMFLAAYRGFRKGFIQIHILWKWLLAATTLFVLVSNIFQGGLIQSLFNPDMRYQGIDGPNRHGLLSVYGAIACTLPFGKSESSLSKFILIFGVGFFVLNLWGSGSRASMLTLVVYFLVLYYRKVIKYGHLLIVLPLSAIGVFSWLVYTGKLSYIANLLRLNISFAANIRIQSMFWGLRKVIENSFMPYGFMSIDKAPRNLILDSSWIWLAIESGLMGCLIMLSLILYSVYMGLNYVANNNQEEKDTIRVLACTAIISAMSVHSVFENHLLVGLEFDTIIFVTQVPYVLSLSNNFK